jgi:hypothetical protein
MMDSIVGIDVATATVAVVQKNKRPFTAKLTTSPQGSSNSSPGWISIDWVRALPAVVAKNTIPCSLLSPLASPSLV